MIRTKQVTWNLPIEIVERVNEIARISHRSPDEIASGVLSVLLAAPVRNVDQSTLQQFPRLKSLSDRTLRRKASAPPNEALQNRLSALLALNSHGSTTPEQEKELEGLLAQSRDHEDEREAARMILTERATAKSKGVIR